MLYETLHSSGHLVVSCCIVHVVSSCMKFDHEETFSFNKCCTIQHFFLFSEMLYDIVLVWPLHATLLYSVVLTRAQKKQFFGHIPLLTKRREIFFANFASCVLVIYAFSCAFLRFQLVLVY